MLEPSICLHAVGQGALAVEVREGDERALRALAPLTHRNTALACAAERAVMRRLEGGCSAPVAAHASISSCGRHLTLEAGVWSLDGKCSVRSFIETDLKQSNDLLCPVTGLGFDAMVSPVAGVNASEWAAAEGAGYELAEDMITRGAEEILEEARIASNKLGN